ncbi:quinol dehydrogenase ferredoxin subunit NapH [Candidatus Thioglobus sp.]|jgi:ferredoxin-type protein NapH|uniref:quinol dehydrogenase ferredoxin subunit NapH n=1 Tax=Candidatus Thioglobus sp. TaxID=2026721 RepID=UPI001E1A99AA|nr:quinol dehydrogenase ferredoxin subunit NapH [Candidatus Thioglobus sp.]MBT3276393.1 quinol dehydrogenase ferredoxin subunit NapH [Candidatus Thioglobus sp.]MBT3744657.1 quinol dehydrogenase ferredoxin subunit NapH [Candidatus Thioglobus sp.]MBT4001288.1 quinol dehydrogenase ferredoxin subunit NapH [Candidatus Thioglobus sp.]MBT4182375.1 quinol dehydrogenase ferredoxin subunit NapH [Candidatus Thioglobus sp.]MBT4422392.1 quinol dehydrogenase ferredoxin subunit NapH [Candidatus Thioglobus sp
MKKTNICKIVGQDVKSSRGWFSANKYLLLRRVSQLSILGLFLLGPWFDIWIIKGNLSSSLILDTVPLTDPFVLLQSIFAGHSVATDALIGALIVLVFYLFVGGRVFCSWVCPVNIVTDSASWLRCKLGIKTSSGGVSNKTRYWLLTTIMIAAFITGSIVWELINPVSILHRGIIFGMSFGWFLIAFIFLFDALVVKRGWCSRICPMGAFYSLLGKFSILRVNAKDRKECTDCLECYIVCPESQVINPALKGKGGIVIMDGNCTNCGRCIDICEPKVFSYSSRIKRN